MILSKSGTDSEPDHPSLDPAADARELRPEKHTATIGIVPLTDCAPIVIAKEKGFFDQQQIDVEISRENTWSSIRDKVAYGLLDGAQMLGGMPIASTLGMYCMAEPMITSFSMNLNGNAITVSSNLYNHMLELNDVESLTHPVSAQALKKVIEYRRRHHLPKLTFAMVFPVSSHHYELRYWMAAAGIDPHRDVRIIVLPPPAMVESLYCGNIDGYCVGEPWNQLAVESGIGHVLITSYEIWNNHPEKVFGVRKVWAEQYPKTHLALIRALIQACRWLDNPTNRYEASQILATSHYVGAPESIIGMSMNGTIQYNQNDPPVQIPNFNIFHRYAANFPWRSHAIWYLTQMMRWGQINQIINMRNVAHQVYQPDIYRTASQQLGLPSPAIDSKTEGIHKDPWTLQQDDQQIELGPDLFLDNRTFNPEDPLGYINQFRIKSVLVDRKAFVKENQHMDATSSE